MARREGGAGSILAAENVEEGGASSAGPLFRAAAQGATPTRHALVHGLPRKPLEGERVLGLELGKLSTLFTQQV